MFSKNLKMGMMKKKMKPSIDPNAVPMDASAPAAVPETQAAPEMKNPNAARPSKGKRFGGLLKRIM